MEVNEGVLSSWRSRREISDRVIDAMAQATKPLAWRERWNDLQKVGVSVGSD